jgi:hypothetical protein
VGIQLKKSFKMTHTRLNTLDDYMENSISSNLRITREPGKIHRLSTENEKLKEKKISVKKNSQQY